MIKIVILIVLCLIIFSGTWYLSYQLYRKIHYKINGPKKCLKVLNKETTNKNPIVVTNYMYDNNNPYIDKILDACKEVTNKNPAIFPTRQKNVVKFIDNYMESLVTIDDDNDCKIYEKLYYIISEKNINYSVFLYLPVEYVKKYSICLKRKFKEKK